MTATTDTTLMATQSTSGMILKQDSRGRILVEARQREELLAAYDKSGMCAHAFAKWVGVKPSTFSDWIQKRRKQEKIPTSGKWVEVVAEAPKCLEVDLGNGAKIKIQDEAQARLAGVLIRSFSC